MIYVTDSECDRAYLARDLSSDLRRRFGEAIEQTIRENMEVIREIYGDCTLSAAHDAAVGACLQLLLAVGSTPGGARRVQVLRDALCDNVLTAMFAGTMGGEG